jgi:hypothetical protein
MSAKTPTVWLVRRYGGTPRWQGELEDPARGAAGIVVDSPAWFAWLTAPTTHTFSYPVYDHAHGYIDGFMTVRKERRQRGRGYWVAYRRCQGQVRKIYLGATAQLTQQRLDQLAQRFLVVRPDDGSPNGTDDDSD